jgi:phospholipid transport system substrate-binding protein
MGETPSRPSQPVRTKRAGSGLTALVILLITALLAWDASAGPADSPSVSPEQLVRQTADQVLNKLRLERPELKAHPGKIYDLIQNLILPHFDFERMSRWVLGPNWRRATPLQRSQFMAEFQDLLINTYGYALLRYQDAPIQYLPSRIDLASGQALVRTEIKQADGQTIPVDYRLYAKQGEWKVFDLSIDGISMVSNYHDSFSEQIQQIGMDGLIKRLALHNQETAG